MIKTNNTEILTEIPVGDKPHYTVFDGEIISQPELSKDNQFAVAGYPFNEFDFDSEDDLLELEFEFNE